jgi:hypothetical protein
VEAVVCQVSPGKSDVAVITRSLGIVASKVEALAEWFDVDIKRPSGQSGIASEEVDHGPGTPGNDFDGPVVVVTSAEPDVNVGVLAGVVGGEATTRKRVTLDDELHDNL